jgi:hypothetical protein
VESKQDYIAKLQVAVQQLHDCGATHVETVPVHEKSRGKTVWKGDVEVFDLHGHAEAKRCYAWIQLDGEGGERERTVAVLEISPVKHAIDAVRFQVVKDAKEGRIVKFQAKLVGGPSGGQIREVDEPYPQIQIAYRVLQKNGKWRTTATATYRLKPESPSPSKALEYEFEARV